MSPVSEATGTAALSQQNDEPTRILAQTTPPIPVECSSEPESTTEKIPELIQAIRSEEQSRQSKDDLNFKDEHCSGDDVTFSPRFVDHDDE